jgi:tol-pal system protein YbgF
MRPPVRAIVLASAALAAACGHAPPKQAELDDLHRTVESLRVQNAAYAKQVEELENRLFILNDRLDSQKVSEQRVETPTLPTVTLHPTPEPEPVSASEFVTTPAGTELEGEPEVEYVGDAAKSSAHRPVLRLHGEGTELSISREEPRQNAGVRVLREGTPKPARDESPEAVALYKRSFEALRAGRHQDAIRGFREFLRTYPGHDLADNSQYWLGECYYDRKDFSAAVREFRMVIERYPGGNKVPDALLKVGFSYLALGSVEAGRQTLSQLERSYPRHEAATLAASKLQELDHSSPSQDQSSLSAARASKAAPTREEAP